MKGKQRARANNAPIVQMAAIFSKINLRRRGGRISPMSKGTSESELRSRYERNSAWAERLALLILVGLAVEIVAVFFLKKPLFEGALTIAANALILAGVWGELLFERRAREAGDGIVAEANARAAEANERASKADLARTELEAQLSPRMLNQEQWDLIQSLKGKFETINIAYETDAESCWFAAELQKAFSLAGIVSAMFSRDPSVHSFSIMIFEPQGFDGARPKTIGPLSELFDARHQLPYGTAAIISGLPTDVLKYASDDEEAIAFLKRTPMIIVGGRFIVPPSHWPRPKPKTGDA